MKMTSLKKVMVSVKYNYSIDGIIRVKRKEIEPIGELGAFVNVIKLVGNNLLVVSTNDKSESILTVYDNLKNIYDMKSEDIVKRGRRPQQME